MSVMEQNRGNRLLLGQNNNALTWLIIINAVIFVALNFIKIIYLFSYDINAEATLSFQRQIVDWFSLPGGIQKFGSRPWTILTFMFSHVSVWDLIVTLLWLWGFGFILQDMMGNSKLIPIYLYAGFAGGVVFLAATNLIPAFRVGAGENVALIGGGAAVMGVAVATTALAPNYRIFPMLNGGIPLWVLTLIFIAIDYATVASSSMGYALAHLAGAGMGFLFVYQLRRGNDWGEWMLQLFYWTDDLFNPEKKHTKSGKPQQHFYKATKKPFEKKPHITQQHIDEILDKINQKGYHFLTDEEKEFLKKASEQDLL